MSMPQRRDEDFAASEAARKRLRDRIEFRPSADLKRKFEEAARLEGQTLTEFLIRSAEERANRVLERHEEMRLSAEAAAKFVDLLVNAPSPNERLRAAFKRHATEVESR
jgi:uncharacterized protein (DUF1778 family)